MKKSMWSLAKILSVPKKVASKIFLRVYIEEEGDDSVKNKYTLNQIGDMLVNVINDLGNFKKETRANFKELRQEVKSINDRLDYIVKANKLKDLPKNKK